PNGRGLSRKHVLASIDASLQRLGMDYVDLYQIHRWDELTPIEETMEALNDVVRAGKAHYLGASSMYAWQVAKAQRVATTPGASSSHIGRTLCSGTTESSIPDSSQTRHTCCALLERC